MHYLLRCGAFSIAQSDYTITGRKMGIIKKYLREGKNLGVFCRVFFKVTGKNSGSAQVPSVPCSMRALNSRKSLTTSDMA